MRTLPTLLLCMLALAGCKSLKTGARQQFSRDYACPDERIEARQRSDLHAGTVLFPPPAPLPPPPAEIANDPERLALWRSNQTAQNTISPFYDTMTVFEVTGCGHRALYACVRASHVNGAADPVSCMLGRYAPQ